MNVITNRKEIFKYFLFYALINALLLYYVHDLIITDPQYFTGGNARSVALYRKVWRFIYFTSPVYEFIKITIISLLIFQAIKLFFKLKVQFLGIVYIVLLAQMLLLIPDILELIWFTFIKPDYSMRDVEYFSPLSLINFIDHQNLSNIGYELLRSINLFNILYWGFIIYFIKEYVNIKMAKSVLVVFCFYGPVSFIFSFTYYFFS